MKSTLLANWSLMRLLRLAIGIWALVASFTNKDMMVGLLGSFLVLTAIANVGCCGAGGCAVNPRKQTQADLNDITYEELDSKK